MSDFLKFFFKFLLKGLSYSVLIMIGCIFVGSVIARYELFDSVMKYDVFDFVFELIPTDPDKTEIKNYIYQEPVSHNIEYRLTYPENVSITFRNSTGDTTQYNDSLRKSICVEAEDGDFYYLSVQNLADHGSVKIEMYIDGILYKTNLSDGAYAIADVSGRLN